MIARGGPRPDPGTLTELFFTAAERFDKRDAFLVKVDGTYRPVSHRQIVERVRHAALGLNQLGIERGARVAIVSETRAEWAIADYACLTAGLTDVPIYPSLPPDQVLYILRNSGAVAAFVSSRDQAEKIASIRAQVPELRAVISFEPAGGASDMTLFDLEAQGRAIETPEVVAKYRQEALSATPDDLATIIYTSGTTGTPKGVMLTHDNLYSNIFASVRALPIEGADRSLSFLPLSHIFARMADHYLMFATGTSIAYAESFESVPANLAEARPTLVLSVPRLYEKFHARALENAISAGGAKQKIFFWATAVGSKWADAQLSGNRPGPLLRAQYALARKLVYSKLHERTGGRLRYFVSGGAPLSPEINKFFYAAGLQILEGYGLTETSPVIAVNTPEHFRIGTVGRPIDGVEVKIAPDGEILTRGPHVMQGYYNDPEATRAVLDDDGWFHTGDIGVLEDGFLRITDRKKDIIVTAGGKNIAPQPIENRLAANKLVNQAVMIGDRRKYPVMLIVPDFDQLERAAREQGLTWSDRTALLKLPEVRGIMDRAMRESLDGMASFEMPKKIGLLEEEFTIDRGELTPTQKIKRRVIDERYRKLIDSLYAMDASTS
ncbi:MAG TPA: long-chain fatty acid--CoA ligase [Gemmatimonadaceae bacterium]|nr:long-chain fatty acid--CoA ligase [Gemmatimonadaceae bacterium]